MNKTKELYGTLYKNENSPPQWILSLFPEKTNCGVYYDKETNRTYVDLIITIPFLFDDTDKSQNKKIVRYCIQVSKPDNVVQYDYSSIGEYIVDITYSDLDEFIFSNNTIFSDVYATPFVKVNQFNYVRNNAGVEGETSDQMAVYFMNGPDSPIVGISKSGISLQTLKGGIKINNGHAIVTGKDLYSPEVKKQTAYLLPGKEDILNQSMNISGDSVLPWVNLLPDFQKICKATNDILQTMFFVGGMLNFIKTLYGASKEIKQTIVKTKLNIKTSVTENEVPVYNDIDTNNNRKTDEKNASTALLNILDNYIQESNKNQQSNNDQRFNKKE